MREPAAAAIPPERTVYTSVRIHLSRFIVPFCLVAGAGAFAGTIVHAQAKPPDTVVLTGSPMGGVKFNHTLHAKDQAIPCETCHHASKPEKPMTAKQQKCTDCHTKVATPPMKTKTQAAFHDPMAKKGLCVDCHQTTGKAKAKGPVPAKCGDCHKKENG